MKYSIAYGRNLDLKRMKERCPHCKLVGKAMLKDWQIAFRKYITVEPCKGGEVPVGVWEIDEVAEKELDIIEEYPVMYDKQEVEITLNGKVIKALVYTINDTHPKYPDKAYLNRVLIGYDDFKFDKKYIFDAISRLPQKRVYIFHDKNLEDYIKACEKVGIATEYGMDKSRIKEFDGVLLTGGGDINPKCYGEENTSSKNIDNRRDKLTIEAIQYSKEHNIPVFGICLGMQTINVAYGGSLKQHIDGHRRTQHEVLVEDGNILHDYVGKNYAIKSFHHQCISRLGEGLTIIAKASDGTPEAVIDKTKKVFGVQWHPERTEDSTMFEIFKTML